MPDSSFTIFLEFPLISYVRVSYRITVQKISKSDQIYKFSVLESKTILSNAHSTIKMKKKKIRNRVPYEVINIKLEFPNLKNSSNNLYS